MTFWNPDTLRTACAGAWLVRPTLMSLPKDRPADLPLPPLHAPILGVSTDSRTLKPGQLFLALHGERFNGHDYLRQAAEAGASILIVDDAKHVPEGGFTLSGGRASPGVIKVADTAKALLKLAAAYRKKLDRTKIIAVCGSNGKTTTTRLIDHVLSKHLRGSASIKSYNNAVGVPLTILAAKENDQYLVCEVGTNAPGEIMQLAEVITPDIAVITSIGREHLEGLTDLAGVAKEEASILRYVQSKGCIIATADAPELAEYLKIPPPMTVVTFGKSPAANLRANSIRHIATESGERLIFNINARTEVTLSMLGEHNALNALAALAVARRIGIDEAKAIAALASAGASDMRLQRLDLAGIRILNDAYNANPDSMAAGLQTLIALRAALPEPPERTIAILGEMRELGPATAACHTQLGQLLTQLTTPEGSRAIDLAILVGPAMQHARQAMIDSNWPSEKAIWVADAGESAKSIAELLRPGDLVLLKGSRGVALERILAALKNRTDRPGVVIDAKVEAQPSRAAQASGFQPCEQA